MSDLTKLTLAEAREGLRGKQFSATELAQAFLDAIEAGNKPLNAYVLATPERALAQAKASDARLAKGDARPLEGLPLGIKDLYCTKGVRTTASSNILDNFTPTYESTVTQNLWDAGAVMLGKLNCDEFAMGSSNETSCFGPVSSPWRRKGSNVALVPGGSSGGSSAAVAADLCLAATATDTGGSIRQPAAITGTVGIKPTYGRCSRWGIVAFASSLDQAGPIAKTVRDAAIMLRHMASVDPKDSTSVDAPVPDYEAAVGQSIKGLRVGVPKEYRLDGMPQGDRGPLAAGHRLAEGRRRHHPRRVAAAHQVRAAGLLHRGAGRMLLQPRPLRRRALWPEKARPRPDRHLRGDARGGFGAEVRRRVLIGTFVLSAGYQEAYYIKAQQVRTLIARDFTQAFEKVDVLLTPTTPGPAFGIGEVVGRSHPDVPQRHLHGDGQHGRRARHLGAGRALLGRHAAGIAADRPPLRRGDAVPRRPGDRGRRGAVRGAGEVVGLGGPCSIAYGRCASGLAFAIGAAHIQLAGAIHGGPRPHLLVRHSPSPATCLFLNLSCLG